MVQIIEYAAVVSAAIYAVGLASRHGMDAVGTLALAVIVSFGGGTLRDLLLDRHPLFWIARERYVVVVAFIVTIGVLAPRRVARLEGWLRVPDALGLGTFAITGVVIARQEGAGPLVSALLGVVTGTFGGVMGEVVCNRVPSLFKPSTPLYASCAFVGAWCFLIPVQLGADPRAVQPFAVAAIVVLRLIAVRRQWKLKPVGDSVAPTAEEDLAPVDVHPRRAAALRKKRANRRRLRR
ncbi:trimeric intracellular cation channel family protein [Alienimonas californiensis]|uniref:Glycine transporter domain-containing protein n=1 Tax=Alienimonas californiensis TaxID=2527989 RepID=A0A517P864_9PLAN|nr:trimeric intracellular cation channel family protein [Alienimonas californiensis]QDT15570.1 hypothetical protein CA12_16550 [Alienimonas californiensis]